MNANDIGPLAIVGMGLLAWYFAREFMKPKGIIKTPSVLDNPNDPKAGYSNLY